MRPPCRHAQVGAGFASSQAMVNKTQQGGKPTVQQDSHDKNIGQREKEGPKQEGAKPTVDKPAESENDDERGKNYGQREGSTIAEDNDVE
jgi:hypothetical protein